MFLPDILALRQFYATPMGQAVRVFMGAALSSLWPKTGEDAMLGMGYCLPYFDPQKAGRGPIIVGMPAQQGAAVWPDSGGNRVFLSHESELPLADHSMHRVLLLHSLEHTEQLSGMMDEVWRVLSPGGRVLAVVPNRMGFWARSSRTPFGHGRPFSMTQLRDLLAHHQFTVTRTGSALFVPPTRWALLWRFARQIESLGRRFCPFLAGVLLIEAEKQVYAAIYEPVRVRRRFRLPLPAGAVPAMGRLKRIVCKRLLIAL